MSGQSTAAPAAASASGFAAQLLEKGVLVISNPRSGQGSAGSTLSELLNLLRGRGVPLTERTLEGERPMDDFIHDLPDYAAVIGAGGDGTVSSLAYALARQKWSVPLLAFPAGTANLIALNLAVPDDPQALLELLLSGQTLDLDLGELVTGYGPAERRRGFAMLAGAGADANMIRESEGLKKHFGTMAYVMAALRQINPPVTTFHIRADGGPVQSFRGIGVMVANLGLVPGRIPITPDISPRDGRFTVILLREGNVLRLGANLLDSLKVKFRLGDPAFDDNLEVFGAQEIEVTADDPFPLQFDGELHVETTPFRARVLPRAVRFFTAQTEAELQT
ncbi:diacylglycerol/lipid kinase family protein [Deinococcus sp. Marseille-Q6407]|uniref:diacylglycerol/lipid kinase family protein n=1 Tax=Deinococcus sp. Marseille-Q6407 TaxID=2969223 RepID=UPI0021BEE097|nr:diacylglycerol kinase family protein [Deinococcus sp. Marseille-Q6407]